jgi:hypothetical protein
MTAGNPTCEFPSFASPAIVPPTVGLRVRLYVRVGSRNTSVMNDPLFMAALTAVKIVSSRVAASSAPPITP